MGAATRYSRLRTTKFTRGEMDGCLVGGGRGGREWVVEKWWVGVEGAL